MFRKKNKVSTLGQRQPTEAGELRQDPVTGKWITIAPGRAQRPGGVGEKRAQGRRKRYQENCPFCNLTDYPQAPDTLRLPDDPDNWQVHVFPNKYPAFRPADEARTWMTGPYRTMEAVGYHEVLATRWHNQTEATMTQRELLLQIEALLLRFRQLREKPSANYIQIIKNHGEEAGASLEHPHHQIFTLPVLPDDVVDMLHGAERYAQAHGRSVFGDVLDFERSDGSRIVWENEHYTILCPFASRVAYEMWIMPREPQPFFEVIDPTQREALAEAFVILFRRLEKVLPGVAYNYFIYSAPCDERGFVCDVRLFTNFRWHVAVMPRQSNWAGLEMATGLEIITTVPETAAAQLREADDI